MTDVPYRSELWFSQFFLSRERQGKPQSFGLERAVDPIQDGRTWYSLFSTYRRWQWLRVSVATIVPLSSSERQSGVILARVVTEIFGDD